MARKRRKPTYNGLEFDSPDELELYWWCEEAEQLGLISDFEYQDPTWVLADRVVETVPRIGKRGQPIKPKSRVLLQGATYTADFHVIGAEERLGIAEYLDVKPKYTLRTGDARLFTVTRKWLYQQHGVLVEPVVPLKLFERTWAPEKAKRTPKRNQPRRGYCRLPSVWDFLRSAT